LTRQTIAERISLSEARAADALACGHAATREREPLAPALGAARSPDTAMSANEIAGRFIEPR
jgi:hypothetical protein